jgi:hypothetical protein
MRRDRIRTDAQSRKQGFTAETRRKNAEKPGQAEEKPENAEEIVAVESS